MSSVRMSDIRKSFGSTKVLDSVSLTVNSGEFFFLLGSSGCGKSTLLRILAGLEMPDQGKVLFGDTDVTFKPPQYRNTSLVFQNYALWPHMTVKENVAFGLENRKVNKEECGQRISEIIRLVHMEGYEERVPGKLSGGQQQRVALARALVVDPQVLLLDEPLSNLDARLRMQMRSELLALHKKTGITSIYVTHDQAEALSMADRIAFIDNGTIVQCGTPRELYYEPQSVSTAKFLGNANIIPGKVIGKESSYWRIETKCGEFLGVPSRSALESNSTEVSCFFRPESILLTKEEGVNTFDGSVSVAMFEGAWQTCTIECRDCSITAHLNASQEHVIAGSHVRFSCNPAAIRILGA